MQGKKVTALLFAMRCLRLGTRECTTIKRLKRALKRTQGREINVFFVSAFDHKRDRKLSFMKITFHHYLSSFVVCFALDNRKLFNDKSHIVRNKRFAKKIMKEKEARNLYERNLSNGPSK